MSLIEYDLFGEKHDKVDDAVRRIRSFEPEDGYYLAYSGGKDSTVLLTLAEMAGVRFDVYYSVTTVDPPELVRFILSRFDTVIYNRSRQGKPDETYAKEPDGKLVKTDGITGRVVTFELPKTNMHDLIIREMYPPTRLARYCCEELKEANGHGRVTMTGVRWAESVSRKQHHDVATIFENKRQNAKRTAQANGAAFRINGGSIILNLDNDSARRTVEMCYRTQKTLVNPIVDWTDADVWEFLRVYNIQTCSLYSDGRKRIGCVGCPMASTKEKLREFKRWPQYKAMYLNAFAKMLDARRDAGKDTKPGWESAEAVMEWWVRGKRWPEEGGLLEGAD